MGEVTPLRRRKAPEGARPIAPESSLRSLFRRETEIEAELAKVRADIAHYRRAYADKHRLLMLPGIDHLRRIFSL